MTNGNTALPAARSTNSKQSEGGGREWRGVIRKRNEEQDQTRERNGGACCKGRTLKVKRCTEAYVSFFGALDEILYY